MAALTDAGLTIDGQPQAVTIHDDGSVTDLYVIGAMYYADGSELPGYHANVRTVNASIIDKLEPLSCVVNSPSFVFA
ncbi:MAG: hypothetical protein ABFE07_15310 [Armatimonadia bacterium]